MNLHLMMFVQIPLFFFNTVMPSINHRDLQALVYLTFSLYHSLNINQVAAYLAKSQTNFY